jgi:hypothetical protein
MARYGDGTKYGQGARYGDSTPLVQQLTDAVLWSCRRCQIILRRWR